MTVRNYIRENWDKSLRSRGHRADGILLPYSYNSPCAEGIFDEFYYWDTCFINKGLIADGKIGDALHNALDMSFLIETYGFMPNAAVTGMLNRSQPPLFGMMLRDIFPFLSDERDKNRLIGALEREYSFWMRERLLPCGLNRYGNSADRETKLYMAVEAEGRISVSFGENDREWIGDNVLAECESGWDFSPRFAHRCREYAPVDLNSFLYLDECTLAEYADSPEKRKEYLRAAEARKEKMTLYCFDGEKLTDAIPGKSYSDTVSAACAAPFVVGLSSDGAALSSILKRLECEKGLAACEKKSCDAAYQWGYPNMWAPLVWLFYEALVKTGLTEDARRIGEKYLSTVERSFAATEKLWEKYDAVTGEKATLNEYAETEMLGWTAGVYNVIFDALRK